MLFHHLSKLTACVSHTCSQNTKTTKPALKSTYNYKTHTQYIGLLIDILNMDLETLLFTGTWLRALSLCVKSIIFFYSLCSIKYFSSYNLNYCIIHQNYGKKVSDKHQLHHLRDSLWSLMTSFRENSKTFVRQLETMSTAEFFSFLI